MPIETRTSEHGLFPELALSTRGVKAGVLPSQDIRDLISTGNPIFSEMRGPEWEFVELPTGHYPMFSRPDDLANLLASFAKKTTKSPVQEKHATAP